MKILYVARFGPRDNQDEEAIAWAFKELGHEVFRIEEHQSGMALGLRADFLLFHKWSDVETMAKVSNIGHFNATKRGVPCFLWFFDLVDGKEESLVRRSWFRKKWVAEVEPYCTAAFYTDGDWVAKNPVGRVHLLQGADERVAGPGEPLHPGMGPTAPILFLGMPNHGEKRLAHLAELEKRFGDRFHVMGGGSRTRKHGRELADICASTKIVIAPDGPCSDRYWSNRVYLITSLGGFLLHPYCAELTLQYEPDKELKFYRSRPELENLIDYYLSNDWERQRMALAGYEATVARHTYKHRCADLIREVQQRI